MNEHVEANSFAMLALAYTLKVHPPGNGAGSGLTARRDVTISPGLPPRKRLGFVVYKTTSLRREDKNRSTRKFFETLPAAQSVVLEDAITKRSRVCEKSY